MNKQQIVEGWMSTEITEAALLFDSSNTTLFPTNATHAVQAVT
jgi:hypothetical protein